MRDNCIAWNSLIDARDWAEALAMPRCEVGIDWWGRSLQQPFRFAIGHDARSLVYVAEVPRGASPVRRNEHGAFVGDLAEPETGADTAELYVRSTDGRYFEIHVSPDGAWWYMDFVGYRDRRPVRIPEGVEVRVSGSEQSWVGAIRLPLNQLGFRFDASVRVQATLALCSGSTPVYITSAGAPGFEPDFHDERCFVKCVRSA
jgi:hypothetical protein